MTSEGAWFDVYIMISPAYISAIPNDEVYPPFMDYALRRKEAVAQINNLSYGVTDFRKRL